jgi:hypothetical protein
MYKNPVAPGEVPVKSTGEDIGEIYGNPVAEVEFTFNLSFYPSLVRMPMARYRRNIWKSGGSR